MTKDDLKILKTKLPKGYRDILAEKFGYTVYSIDKFIRGAEPNLEVIEYAIKMAKDHQKKLQDMSKNINNL